MVFKKMKSGNRRLVPDKGSRTGKAAKPRASSGFTAASSWKAFANKSKGGYKSKMSRRKKGK